MGGVGEPSYGPMGCTDTISVDALPESPVLPARYAGLRPWQPGQSGNPGGRPKDHIIALARQRTAKAIQALEEALEVPSTRVAAAAVLLDRGWGKPTQHLEHTGADGGPIQTQELPPDTRMTIDAFIAEWREVPAVPADGGQ